jgi:hypothetical protein
MRVAHPAQRKGVAGAGTIPAAVAEQVLVALSALLVYGSSGCRGAASARGEKGSLSEIARAAPAK